MLSSLHTCKYKYLILAALAGILFFSIDLPEFSPFEFEINGKIISGPANVSFAHINVYKNDTLFTRYHCNDIGEFNLKLNYNENYIIEIVRNGYISQKVIISTQLPENTSFKIKNSDSYYLELEIYKMFKDLDLDFFKAPILKYIINVEKRTLEIDQSYSLLNNFKVKQKYLLAQIENIKEEIYRNEIAVAESLLILKEYEKAWLIYNEFGDYTKDNKLAKARIKEIERFIYLDKTLSNNYDERIKTADSLFKLGEFKKSENYYIRASLFSDERSYIIKQIYKIDSIENSKYIQQYNEYRALLKQGAHYASLKKFKIAKEKYKQAKEIIVALDISEKSITEINDSIGSLEENEKKLTQKKQQEYNALIKKAEKLFKNKNYETAKKVYSSALDIMPESEYPKLKIGLIDELIIARDSLNEGYAKINKLIADYELKIKKLEQDKISVPQKDSILKIRGGNSGRKIEPDEETKKVVLNSLSDTLKKINNTNNDSVKSKSYSNIGKLLYNSDIYSKAIDAYEKSFEIESKSGNTDQASSILKDIAKVYYDSGAYNQTIQTLEESATLKKETGDTIGASNMFADIGNVYENTYAFDKAIDFYEKSINERKKTKDKKGMAKVMINIAEVLYKQKNLDKSINSYKNSLELNTALNNKEQLGKLYNNLGMAYYEKGDYELASEQFIKSLDINDDIGNKIESSMALNNIGNAKYEQSKYRKAIDYYKKSVSLKEDMGYDYGLASSLSNIGNAYRQIKNYSKAIEFFEKSDKISEDNRYEDLLSKNYKALLFIFNEIGDKENINKYNKLLDTCNHIDIDIDDQIGERHNFQTNNDFNVIQYLSDEINKQKETAEKEIEKRENELKLHRAKLKYRNAQLKKQRIFLVSLASGILLVIIATIVIYYQLIQKKRANIKLAESNVTISTQKKHLTDNIHMARRIQKAALPPEELLRQFVEEYFILNRPKDIVSGDFYWAGDIDGNLAIAVADCTGHGVHGAVMSMLGMAFLNEIAHKNISYKPNEILNELRNRILGSLHSGDDEYEIVEGMDMVFCSIDRKNHIIEFAGAKNPIFIYQDNEIKLYPGNRMPIGHYRLKNDFSMTTIKVSRGDTLYMFSDGYQDQLGGNDRKRFSRTKFIRVLQEISNRPIDERKKTLEEELDKWKGNNEQIDDILVLGVVI